MSWDKLQNILHYVEKPARYIGNEINITVKKAQEVDLRFALAFPDVYEIGTSYLGFQILYDIINSIDRVQAERVFAPWPDMEQKMREVKHPLFGLETKTALRDFDIIGFTLQYELGYTNLLNMLDLAGLSPLASERDGLPLVLAGGPGALNPEPLADFVDAFVIGEGEEVTAQVIEVVLQGKKSGWGREKILAELAQIQGIYVPSFFAAKYDEEGRYIGTFPIVDGIPAVVKKRIIKDFANLPLPKKLIAPLVQPVHDRVSIEICRGCARGCRFCQAGIVYRPVRERSTDKLVEQGGRLVRSSGSAELGLSSLSSADHSDIENLVRSMMNSGDVSVSLPSLRVDSYSVELARLTKTVRKTGLTLAPEAGSQRLRDVINKNVTEDDIFSAARKAFEGGWQTVKLYFMIGLPTESEDDVAGIADIVFHLEKLYREVNGNTKRFKVNIGIATFVPKPHTPFQWSAQLDRNTVSDRQRMLKEKLKADRFKVQTTGWLESNLEASLARGDRNTGKAIFSAWKMGCRFDAWTEHFRPDLWRQAFEESGIQTPVYTLNPVPLDQPLPWDHIDVGVSKDFLAKEYKLAFSGQVTPDCTLENCSVCGICNAYAVTPLKRGKNK